jgi:SAM-dependent methyltransferase
MKEFWDKRYAEEIFAYGKEPNEFLKEEIGKIPQGRILLPCDGEGRNGVYCASIGWNVLSFDQSESGKNKAMLLAKEKSVSIEYLVSDIENLDLSSQSFDCIALIYAHFPSHLRQAYHRKMISYLKPGGHLILEGFHKNQIEYQKTQQSGGPKEVDMLFSKEELIGDFQNMKILRLSEEEVDLREGIYHLGKAFVVRLRAELN